jgi:hypothetical protein
MNRIRLSTFLSIILALALNPAATLMAEAGISTAEVTPTKGTLVVKVNVSDANVYLDGGIVGTGSVSLDNISPGLHRLTVIKDGYYAQSLTVRVIAGETTKVSVALVPMTGTVEITGIPENTVFSVKIGDREYASKRIEVAEGHRNVTIRVFGYREQTLLADVRGRHTTVIEFKGEPAPFEVGDLAISRRTFNPDNPALLGCAEISFTASAPGTGRLELRDASGATIKTIVLAPFTTWKQRVVWDGTGNDGSALPDGTYPLSVSVASTEGKTEIELVSNATIDRSIEYPILGMDPGVGATGPVVSAAFLPARAIRFDADASGFGGAYGAGMSIAAGFAGWLETGARFAAVTDGGEESALDFACGIKAGKRFGGLRAAASLNWRARTEYVSDSAGKDRNGIGIALPLEYRAGRVSLGITPSIAFGDGLGFMNDPYFTAGAGATVRADLGNVFLAAFVNADSVAFGGASSGRAGNDRDGNDDTAVLGPIGGWSAGASARAILPSTSVMLSLGGGYAKPAGETGGAYASGGIGIAF